MINNNKEANIKKELISLTTYPYSDPSPVPEFGRLYPYNRFDGYTDHGTAQDWEMIVMENAHIKLWINPSVGGKVWGAVEKATGKEFIYFNHVAKFRDVAMRGPWTSGGMENNMGIIGHTPSCSAPVDHAIRKNEDGSVSCFIGATDWPSRTTWTVEYLLKPDTAYFLSRSTWYNNSGMEQSYYQWNNVGVKVTGNLEYINPGYQRIGHDGKNFSWPKDEENREISFYDKNNFGEYKSYHIFGSYSDFWGCYWHNDDFGFGHSASYDEKPGKKIWIWGLSRYGMIWEDLLTDTDGQYTELQAGRLFNQSIAASSKTPFKHSSFTPYTFDEWDEYWFPVKNTGGLTYGNALLSFYLSNSNGAIQLNICANQDLNHRFKIEQNGKVTLEQQLTLKAMENTVIELPGDVDPSQIKIWLNTDLIYNASEQNQELSRPAEIVKNYDFDSVQAIYIQAKEWERQRFYARSVERYQACLKVDPFYIEALTGLAGLFIRQNRFEEALSLLKKALSINTYHDEANYLYGAVNVKFGLVTDAKDGFSIAAFSQEYRSAAYTELAKIFFRERQFDKALSYLKKSLQYNTKNQLALQLEVLINRLQGKTENTVQLAAQLSQSNPLNHLIRFEQFQSGVIEADEFISGISSELPYETYLELSTFYSSLELYDLSLDILALSPDYPMVSIWQAYLKSLQNAKAEADQFIEEAIAQSPAFVFPHRSEDILILEWAIANYPHWHLKYYLAAAYIQALRTDEALKLLQDCKDVPDFYVFYIVRANLQKGKNEQGYESDLFKANQLAPNEWRTILILSKYLAGKDRWFEALELVRAGFKAHPDNYYLGIMLAGCFMQNALYEHGIALMNKLKVLPNEGASDGRNIWKETHLFAALNAMSEKNWQKAIGYINEARRWPENMGVGKPYEVDERLENFMELCCLLQSGQPVYEGLTDSIGHYRDSYPATPYSSNDFLTIYLLQQNHQPEKVEQILDNWSRYDQNDLSLQWTKAFMVDDEDRLTAVAVMQPEKREALPYEILFEDRSFPFVKDLHKRGYFKTSLKTENKLTVTG